MTCAHIVLLDLTADGVVEHGLLGGGSPQISADSLIQRGVGDEAGCTNGIVTDLFILLFVVPSDWTVGGC